MKKNNPRPISPHLEIYRPQLTSVLSILHRLTGLILVFGFFLAVLWLCALAYSPSMHHAFLVFFHTPFGRLLWFGLLGALMYHLCNGIRHLFWDIGKGFEISTVYRSGWVVVAVSALLTVLTFVLSF